jgi:hypothetical protein
MKPTIPVLIFILFVITPAIGFQQKAQEPLTRYSPEKCGMSLELPVQYAPSVVRALIPENLQGKIFYTTLSITQTGDMAIVYSHMSAIEHLRPKSVAQGTIDGFTNSAGISDLKYTTEPSTDLQAPIKGTFTLNNIAMEINGIVFSKEKHTWCDVCVYKQSSKTAQAISQRILASIKLDGSPCPEK